MKDQDIKNQLWEFYSHVRGHIDYYGSAKKIIQLLFLRSVLDDATGYNLKSVEDMKALFKLQNEFAGMNLTETTIRDAFAVVDCAFFGSEMGLSKAAPLYQFFFGARAEDQRSIIGALQQFVLPLEPEGRWEVIKAIYQSSSRDIRRFEESNTPDTLIKLGNSLLDVKPSDFYMDAFSGLSSAFLSLPDNGYVKYEGFELNADTFATSLMLIIMLKKKNAFVYNADFFNVPEEPLYDKVFCDGPLNLRLDGRDNLEAVAKYGIRESDVLSFYRISNMLKEKGRAVITVAGKFLFSNAKPYEVVRQRFTEEGLKAIVYLPGGILATTMIPINVVLLEKGYKGPIALVDARELTVAPSRLEKILEEKTISEIVHSVEGMDRNVSYVRIVDRDELLKGEQANWNPGKLFETKDEKVHRSLPEIEADIEQTLQSLVKLVDGK